MTNDQRPEKLRFVGALVGAGRRLLQWLAVTLGIFVWWMAVLLLFSLILVNQWHTSLVEIVKISLLLTAVCSLGYAFVMLRREKRG